MMATLRLKRKGGLSPGWALPLMVELDGQMVRPIWAGMTATYTVEPGSHQIRVRRYWSWSETASFEVAEGGVAMMECGCTIQGWLTLLVPAQMYGMMASDPLWYVRPAEE